MLVRPRNSEVHSVPALGSGFHHLPPDSLTAALARTFPRQRRYRMVLLALISQFDAPSQVLLDGPIPYLSSPFDGILSAGEDHGLQR